MSAIDPCEGLRPYQQKAIQAVKEAWRAGKRAILLVSPTGSGKTRMASSLGGPSIRKGNAVSWFVHRDELVDQAREAFERIGLRAGIVAAGATPDRSAAFQIVSVQTAVSRGYVPDSDIVFLDEAHHFAAAEWGAPVLALRSRPGVTIIGMTATPERGDGVGLECIFDHLHVVAQPKELIAQGHLVPVRVIGPSSKRKSLSEHPVAAWNYYARGRQTIVFGSSIEHARTIADQFNACKVPAACVDGKTSAEDRKASIKAFRAGKLRVLTNVYVLTEGFDAPETSCVLLARNVTAPGTYIQMVGRGLRVAPWAGKTDCIVVDLMGVSRGLCMLPDDSLQFSLAGKAIKIVDGLDDIRQCPRCGATFRAHEFTDRTCPACGFMTKGRENPAIRRARMEAYSEKMPEEERVAFLAAKVIEAKLKVSRGERRKDGGEYQPVKSAVQAFKVRFRQWPTKEQIAAALAKLHEANERAKARASHAEQLQIRGVG